LASASLALALQAQAAPRPPSASVPIVEVPGDTRAPGVAERRRCAREPHSVHIRDSTFWGDLRKARRDIDRRQENGELSAREARELRREAAVIASLADRYGRGGLSDPELRELEVHAQALRSQVVVRAARPASRQS
jgi:hypothetical protein